MTSTPTASKLCNDRDNAIPQRRRALDANQNEIIYLFDGDTAEVVQTFVAPEYNSDTGPAPMVAYGNLLLAGTPEAGYVGDNGWVMNAGAVYVFSIQTGELVTTLMDPTPAYQEHFGRGIAVTSDGVYISTEASESVDGTAAAIYAFDPSTWQIVQTYAKPGAPEESRWGHPLLLQGDRLLAGAVYDDVGAENAGAVHIFDLNTTQLLATWTNPDPQPDKYFGRSLAAVADHVLVGATGDRTTGTTSGTAFRFDTNGNLMRTYVDPNPDSNDRFGADIAAVGDYIAVGDLYDDAQRNADGAVQIFKADPAGIHLAPTVGLTTSEDGTSVASFDVVLNTQPVADVTLDLSTSDPGEAALSVNQLIFTNENWNQSQTVSLTGVDDGLADGDQFIAVNFDPSTGSDATYDGLQLRSLSVLVLDSISSTKTFSSRIVDLAIPEPRGKNPGRVTSTIDVSDTGTILDLNATHDITHTSDGQLTATLYAPDGTPVELFSNVGGSGDNFTNTGFDEQATTSIAAGSAPFSGIIQPAGSLATFNDMDAAGTWTLEISDNAKGDTGTLNSWSIEIATYEPEPNTPPVAVDDSDATDEDTPVTINVLANDSDVEDDTLTVTDVSDPPNGTAVINPDNTITYTPDAGFSGSDTFDYTISDGNGGTDSGTVSITVSSGSADVIYVFDITFESKANKGRDWRAVFQIRTDSDRDGVAEETDDAAVGATITVEFAGNIYSGTTDSNGVFTTGWIKNLSGHHGAQVTELALLGYLWDMGLGEDDSDEDADLFPDEYRMF
jgi:subtilisin-like proprotein convertase family protein